MRQSIVHRFIHFQSLQTAAVLCALMGVVGCASALPGPAEAGDRAAEAALLSTINTTIGDAACTSDTQCRTIGLGANACGGPAAWRPWSTQTNGQGDNLRVLAERLSALQRSRQAQSGMVSTCRYIPDPGASCQAQRCVLNSTPNPAS